MNRDDWSPLLTPDADETLDLFLDGRLKLIQPRNGYRFSVDAVLLAEFVLVKPGDTLIDLGTGCGIMPLMLLLKHPLRRAIGLEIQPILARQAGRNAILNGFANQMHVLIGDLKHPPLAQGAADLVICNPPYRRNESGRINPDPQRAIARHEIMASLNDILAAGRDLLRTKGRLALVYPATRLADLLVRLRAYQLEPKRLQMVYPGLQAGAKLVLIEAALNARSGLQILPPLLDQGDFSIGT
jgi:tRNA1Val (adenine37-N6)-methyltransferase